MKKTADDFDESILDSEEEFNKRFKPVKRPKFVDSAIKKALKESKNRITIYLDADIVEHFKTEAQKSKLGYQTLINQALREKINASQTVETAGDIIEKIIKDKNALSRLKAELETV
jgi:uncharacterized protein (DUF4415 family)